MSLYWRGAYVFSEIWWWPSLKPLKFSMQGLLFIVEHWWCSSGMLWQLIFLFFSFLYFLSPLSLVLTPDFFYSSHHGQRRLYFFHIFNYSPSIFNFLKNKNPKILHKIKCQHNDRMFYQLYKNLTPNLLKQTIKANLE